MTATTPRQWRRLRLAGAMVVLVAGTATAASAGSSNVTTLDETACGTGWAGPATGRQTITVENASRDTVQVYLIDPGRNLVYAEARDVTPGTSRALATTLGTGRYALRCVFSNGTIRTSKAYPLKGTEDGVPGVAPMNDLDLGGPVTAYRAYVQASLPVLLKAAQRLDADVTAGNLGRARTDWLPAHLDYERLGAAYNTFEDFDAAINGMRQEAWTGFFRIEYGLWHAQPASELEPLTAGLVAGIRALIRDFPSEDTDPVDLPLRSHEILENALEFQVSGAADYGSGTTLATVYANTQGTEQVLSTITALVSEREPALLASIDRWLATVQADLTGCRNADGTWIAVSRLPQRRRQQLDGDLGELLEQLAVIPNLLQERTSA